MNLVVKDLRDLVAEIKVTTSHKETRPCPGVLAHLSGDRGDKTGGSSVVVRRDPSRGRAGRAPRARTRQPELSTGPAPGSPRARTCGSTRAGGSQARGHGHSPLLVPEPPRVHHTLWEGARTRGLALPRDTGDSSERREGGWKAGGVHPESLVQSRHSPSPVHLRRCLASPQDLKAKARLVPDRAGEGARVTGGSRGPPPGSEGGRLQGPPCL